MKALKSARAQAMLADPDAKHQLQAFLASRSKALPASSAPAPDSVIRLKSGGKTVRLALRVVAKAP